MFETTNAFFQSSTPQIQVLRSGLLNLLQKCLVKFVKAEILKKDDCLVIDYHKKENQKDDQDLLIGQQTSEIVSSLNTCHQKEFYTYVRKYYISACDYMVKKFPFNSNVLKNAEVAQLSNQSGSFSNLKFFIDKYPLFLHLKEGEDHNKVLDQLQTEFSEFQAYKIPSHILEEKRIDVQWIKIGAIENEISEKKFLRLSKVMLSILTLPHSNAECERIFSQVRKIKTDFRGSISNNSLEKLLISKLRMSKNCYETEFERDFLKKAKSCSTSFVSHEK